MPSKPKQTRVLLTIAGFDPSSGAGVTADLMVFAAHGFFGTSCITALTVQNTLGVFATQAVATDTLASTLEHLASDLPPVGIKIGMLANRSVVRAVASFLTHLRASAPLIVVLDPVLKSSHGNDLLDVAGLMELRETLLPLVDWITPNRSEFASLCGTEAIDDRMFSSAVERLRRGTPALKVVVTGGDQIPPVDVLLQAQLLPHLVEGKHLSSSATHGTGCAFSSALLCRLVLGDTPTQAVQNAKAYVAEAIRTAPGLGTGKGPLNLLWLRPVAQDPAL